MYIFLEKKPNCLQTVVTQIRCRVQRRLIWVCTVCQLPFRVIQNTMGKWEPWWYSRKYKLSDKNTCITIISWLGAKFGFISEIQRIPQQLLMFILLEIFIWGSGDHKRSPRWQKNSILLSIQHHSERRFFCLAFYFKWKYFVLIDLIWSETICLFCFCVLFSNIYPKIKFMIKKIDLTYAVSIVMWFFKIII